MFDMDKGVFQKSTILYFTPPLTDNVYMLSSNINGNYGKRDRFLGE